MAIAIGQFTIYDFHDVYSSPVAPIKPTKDMLWLDTSVKPPLLRVYNGTEWVIANDFTDEIENAITETKKEINQSIESKISTAKSEILLSVKETYETKETVTAKVNSTKNELNSEIGKKANSADVYKKTETYTKTEVDNAITVNKNGIMTQVKETYETKENVTTKIDNIKFGGRNYIEQSKGDKKLGFFLNFDKVENGYGEHTLTSQKTYSNVNIAPGFILGARDYEVGKNIVFSYDIMYTKWDFPSGTTRSEFWIGQRYTNSSTSTDGQWRGVTQHNLPIVGVHHRAGDSFTSQKQQVGSVPNVEPRPIRYRREPVQRPIHDCCPTPGPNGCGMFNELVLTQSVGESQLPSTRKHVTITYGLQ